MKKQFLTKFALATLAITMCGLNANAQLGNLKNKVKNAAGNVGGNKDEKKDEKKNDTSTNSSNSSSSSSSNSSTNNSAVTSSNGTKTANDLNWYKVDKTTTIFSADCSFNGIKTSFKTGENIFVRFAFPKSVTDMFNEKFPDHQKSTAKYSLAISKNIDTDPIIISTGTFSVYNYEKVNMMDFTISGDPKTFSSFDKLLNQNKISMRSASTLNNVSISTQWEALSPTFTSDMKDWEIFLVFAPGDEILDDRKPELVNQGKFSFTYDANASNSQYAAYIKPLKAIPDEGITSDVHKKLMKQVVFSKTAIAKSAVESSLTNSFNLGDDIYFRVYLEKSIINESNAIGYETNSTVNGVTAFDIFIDGKKIVDMPATETYQYSFSKSEHQYPTTFTDCLSRNWGDPDDKGKSYKKALLDFYYNAVLLSPGTHKVTINTTYYVPENGATPEQQYQKAFGKEKLLATGEFSLNVTEAGKVAIGKKLCSMPDIKTEVDYFKIAKAPTKVPQAAEWVKKNINEKGINASLVKVVEGDEWAYIKNSWGIITHRELWGNAFLLDKTSGLYYSRRIKYTEQNISSGGAKYGSTVWEWSDYSNVGIRFAKECVGK